jgi:hypothetical protein
MVGREEDTGEERMQEVEQREAAAAEELDHYGMSDQPTVRVVRKEPQVEGTRTKTQDLETAEAASRVSIASIQSSISNATSGRRSTLSSVRGEDGGQSPSSFFGGGSPGGALSGSERA